MDRGAENDVLPHAFPVFLISTKGKWLPSCKTTVKENIPKSTTKRKSSFIPDRN